MSFFAQVTYTGDGTTDTFSVPFPYIKEADVVVRVDNVVTSVTFNSATQVQLASAPANGAAVLVQRVTDPSTLLAVISSGSRLKASEINTTNQQLLYVVQEANDTATTVNASISQVTADVASVEADRQAVEAIAADIETTYDIGIAVPYDFTISDTLGPFVLPREVILPASATGSTGFVQTVSTSGATVLSIRKNGTEVGTVSFAQGSSTPTFSVSSATTFAVGDRLTLVPSSLGTDFAIFGVTLKFQRADTT